MIKGKKLLIFHFRVGGTDGVSLEIANWKEILERKGIIVELCAGNKSIGATYRVKHFENQRDRLVFGLDEEAFGGFHNMDATGHRIALTTLQSFLKNEFTKILKRSSPDAVLVSNVFSVGQNISSAGALIKALDEVKLPTLAVCHDFYWENKRFATPSSAYVAKQLKNYFPPKRDYIKYCTINSIARKALYRKKGIKANILADTIDFKNEIKKDDYYGNLLKLHGISKGDIVVLQATRVVRRKNIELAIDFCKVLDEKLKNKGRMNLYNGKIFDPAKNKLALVVSGYAEKRDYDYLHLLRSYAKKIHTKIVILNGRYQDKEGGLPAILKLHQWADIVTYPSEYEGFGNQFLEAIYSKKPVVLFEYPVFKNDIGPKGFKIISLGNKVYYGSPDRLVKLPEDVIAAASDMTLRILTDKSKYKKMVEHNFKLGVKHYSFEVTYKFLQRLLFDSFVPQKMYTPVSAT